MDLYILTLVTIAVSSLITYMIRFTRRFNNTGIPHESPWPFFGNMLPVALGRVHLTTHITNLYNNWPNAKYFGFYDFLTPVIIVRDLELIKAITVKHFDHFMDHRSFVNPKLDPLIGKNLFSLKGDEWRRSRNLLSPAFTTSKLHLMFELISICANDFSNFAEENCTMNAVDTDMKDAFTKYSNDVIATCAFGISVNSMKNPDNDFYVFGKKATNFEGWRGLRLMLNSNFPNLSKLLRIKVYEENVTAYFKQIIQTTIETREKEGIYRPDMIQLMMEANNKNVIQLDLMDMTSQAFGFYAAGFETSATLMAYTAVELAVNQEVQNKLLVEVDDLMEKTNGKPTFDDVNSMCYLEAILHETLRIHTLTGFLDRICIKSYVLPPALPGQESFTVKAGTNVWIASDGIHNDPAIYSNPEKFYPERFLGKKYSPNSPTNLSFGIGPRICIGNRFAILETKLVFLYMLRNSRLEKSSKLKESLKLSTFSISSMIEGGFWLQIVPRNLKCNGI